jgi:hypothetical protein
MSNSSGRAPQIVAPAAGTSELLCAALRLRLNGIDLLSGLIVLMALKHPRDFFAPGGPNSRDLADAALFLTRWVPQLCAASCTPLRKYPPSLPSLSWFASLNPQRHQWWWSYL